MSTDKEDHSGTVTSFDLGHSHTVLLNPAVETRAREIVGAMTEEEKIDLISGIDGMWTKGVPRLGLRRLHMADASMGLRDYDRPATAFPASICLAATWNRETALLYGQCVGAEFRAAGYDVLLGPGVNIYRVPQCGRNFEYLGEDPFLTSAVACAYIRGAQSQGVAATVKHLAANNSDWHRCVSNSVVDEQTLHEIYLPAFDVAVHEAGVLSMMTSYNLLNGEYTAESESLVRGIVLDNWKFPGVVMSDWEGTWSGEKTFHSGLHLEMPRAKTMTSELVKQLIKSDPAVREELDRKVYRIVRWTVGIEWLQSQAGTGRRKCAAHRLAALDVARQGVVLLKNQNQLLPLSPRCKRVHIVGPCAFSTPTSGGGAALVEAIGAESVLEAFLDLAPDIEVNRSENQMDSADAVIVCVGLNSQLEHEGSDRSFELPWEQEALVRRAVAANPRTVVVLFGGGAFSMESWIEDASAVLHGWYPGECGARAIVEIILGLTNPSGKLPISIERRWCDSPAYANYIPDGGASYENPDYLGLSRPVFDVRYKEGLFVGYRHYDHLGTKPLFSFGHGLSYTTFDYSDLTIERGEQETDVIVSFTVSNTGSRAGREVAQAYIGTAEADGTRPVKELKGFESITLKAGESQRLFITLNRRAFSMYDVRAKRWKIAANSFRASIGASASDMRLEGEIVLR